jgi:carbamoyltransferase
LIVLGVSDHFVSGASLVVDGRLVAAVNEERLARMKMVMGFPWKSISAVLEIGGVSAQDVDVVAVASKWGHFLGDYVDTSNGVLNIDEGAVKNTFFNIGSKLSSLRGSLPFLEPLYYQLRQPSYWRRRKSIEAALKKEYGLTCPVRYTWHHHAHAACAYYASGFDDALVVTLDGSGDGHSSHVYEVDGGKWKFLHAVPSFDGIGNFYGYVTHIAGFKAGRHEGKITGLAAHGNPVYEKAIEELIRYEDGSMRNIGNAFRHRALSLLNQMLPKDYSREDLAASIQSLTENIAVSYVDYWLKKTGKKRVALAGGVVANVKVNQRIHELPGVEEIFIYPAMSDEGLSAGSALIEAAKTEPALIPGGARCFDHVYLGHGFSEKQIVKALRSKGLPVSQMTKANDWLNERLDRTEFMPFAPVTLSEDAEACYINLQGAQNTARFMTITFDCTPKMAKTCPGVVHVDGTARPQIV